MDFLDIVMELRKHVSRADPRRGLPQLVTMDSTVTYLQPLLKDVGTVA